MFDEWKTAAATVITVLVGSSFVRFVSQWLIKRELNRYESMDIRLERIEDHYVTRGDLKQSIDEIKAALRLQDASRARIHSKIEDFAKEVHKVDLKLARLLGARDRDEERDET